MADYKIYKNGNLWRAIVAVGSSGLTLTFIGKNLDWICSMLATVCGIK